MNLVTGIGIGIILTALILAILGYLITFFDMAAQVRDIYKVMGKFEEKYLLEKKDTVKGE